MKNMSTKSLILNILFCLIFFGSAITTLYVIDAYVTGWIFLVILLAAFWWFRLSKFWDMCLSGKLGKFNKIWIYILVVITLGANNRLSRPQMDVSYRGTLVREYMREALNLPMLKGDGMLSAGADLSKQASSWKAPKGYSYTKADCGVPVELLKKENSDSKKLIFQIHGGAYVIGMTDLYRNQAVKYSKIYNDASVVNIDYRIAPEYVFPAALEDALLAWDWILQMGYSPKDITVIGDSAGGNLTLALCLKLRDEGKELPEKIVCLSPWADLASTGESHTTNLFKDPMFGLASHSFREVRNADKIIKAHQEASKNQTPLTALYAGNTDLYDPYLSPVFGDFTGFPKTLIQVGTWEVLQCDSEMIFEKCNAAGVQVVLQEYNGMYHVFQQAGTFIPEGKKAWKAIENFLKS